MLDWTLKIGGQAGQGMQAIGNILAKVFARAGLHVFVSQDFESRIRGGHNFLQMRVSDAPVGALSRVVDVLVALDETTVGEHSGEVAGDGIVVWDPDVLKGVEAGEKGFPAPLERLTAEAGGQKVMMNSTAVGVVLGMVRFPVERMEQAFGEEFSRKGAEVVEANLKVARAGYGYAVDHCTRCRTAIGPREGERRMILTGHQAVGLGALAAGVRFISAYPMSPSTSIIEFLAPRAEAHGVVVEQAEDEIAAINMAVGAGYAGVRAMTATSGGGLCLMVEGVGLAGMTETPVVIVDAQRPGPSTGLPTRTEQSDLLFVIHAAHGEFPRAVLAPGDPEQAFACMGRAFNLAEKYQMPVFVMTDQHLADSAWTLPPLDPSGISIERGELLGKETPADYARYRLTPDGISPRGIPGASAGLVVADSDEHTEEGHITESAAVRGDMMRKRLRKLEKARAEMLPPERHGPETARVTLLCWGSARGAIFEAVDRLNAETPQTANGFHFTDLWPLPADTVLECLGGCDRLVTVEGNATGQLARLLRMETGLRIDDSVLRCDGRPLVPAEIADAVRKEVLS